MLFRLVLAVASALSSALIVAGPAWAVSPDVVISQVYGGGGNAGATLKNDFIELYNRGSTPVDLSTWTVQYASAPGSTWQRTTLSGSIAPGKYYLVQEAAGAGGTTDLPIPDATGSIAMSATSGKVALVTNATLLACSVCLPNAAIQDFVGYGSTASDSEGGAPTANLSNTTAALRGAGGQTDTDNNGADFAVGAPTPRNGGTAAPAVASTTPANNAVDVALDASISVSFTTEVNVAPDWFSLSCTTSGAHAATFGGGPVTFNIDPTADFVRNETCTLTVVASRVTDQDTADPPDAMQGDFALSFRTIGIPARIREIQGATHRSTLLGQRVAAVPGVVTGLHSNAAGTDPDSFYFQDTSPDADPATSEGILVFTSTLPAVAIGDNVLVNGTVAEFRRGSATNNNLTITELTAPAVQVLSSGNPLPAPIVIGRGGRIPPNVVIDDDTAGTVEAPPTVFDPANDGIDFYESLEGMLVRVNNPVTVGPTNSFGEIFVLADRGANASVRTNRGGIVIRANDFNPERLLLDDELIRHEGGRLPPVHVGDLVNGSVVGIIDYDFGNFRVEVTAAPAFASGGITREVTAPSGPSQLSVGTFNVENLDSLEPESKFATLANLIVNHMRSPDLLTLEEVQDNNGALNDGTVDPTQTLNDLTSAIQAAGGPAYQFRQINPVNNQDGGEPGGNIRVVFLFRTDRGLSFVDRAGGGPTTPTTVVNGPTGPQLSASPGRVDPTSAAWNASRKPLAGEFLYNGHRLFVIGNHFNSKGGDQPLFGRFQPPSRVTETQRHQQATIVNDFVDSILAVDANANVIVLGDINDFEFSETMNKLTSGGILTPLMTTLPQRERYSYVFEGNSQSLDHIVVSRNLLDGANAVFDVVHVNSEFADQASDHDPQVALFTMPPGALRLNGRNGYADTPHTADLNLTGDWTIESWFLDETPGGFNHELGYLVGKIDSNTEAEAPYFLRVGWNRLAAGVRTDWENHVVDYNLHEAGVDPKAWHHAAASFESSSRTLKLYVDGLEVARGVLPEASSGNTLPVQIGRNGNTGHHFRGGIDDVRIWNVVRSNAQIEGAYRAQLTSTPPGLVANWKLDERDGTVAADSAGGHSATLHRGAAFIDFGHP